MSFGQGVQLWLEILEGAKWASIHYQKCFPVTGDLVLGFSLKSSLGRRIVEQLEGVLEPILGAELTDLLEP